MNALKGALCCHGNKVRDPLSRSGAPAALLLPVRVERFVFVSEVELPSNLRRSVTSDSDSELHCEFVLSPGSRVLQTPRQHINCCCLNPSGHTGVIGAPPLRSAPR